MRFSINCSTVICWPTVILMLSWEKPLVKPMAPESISYHICFQSTFICIFTFCIYIIKYQKYIYLIILSLLDVTFTSGREGIDNPFIALVASSLFVCVGAWDFEEPPTGLIPWFSKTEGNTYATIAASPSLVRGKPTQAQDVAWANWHRFSPDLACLAGHSIQPPPRIDVLLHRQKGWPSAAQSWGLAWGCHQRYDKVPSEWEPSRLW